MGNSPSNSDVEEDRDFKEMDDGNSDNEDGDKDGLATTDLSGLFNHTSLRNYAAKIKEEIPENVLQQYRFQIVRWLEDRESKMEETLTIAHFCDWLMNKGVSRDDAIKAFQQFDVDGSGVVEVDTVLETVKSINGPNILGELGRSIRMLQACSLVPGFVDVYSGDKNAVKQHSERILKYLLRNRSPSLSLPFPYLNGFNNTTSMRNSVLKSTFKSLKESAQMGGQASLGSGEEVRTISPCHTSIEVSSNTADVYRITNGDPNTFWQSDGSARSHWMRLHIKHNVVIKSLSISVASSDSSYMPEVVSITGGKSYRGLRPIKEVRIPSHITGEFLLLKNAKIFYPIIQINIKKCRNDGCDTRIHGIKTVGYKVIREASVSVTDAAAIWYLQILATTVTTTMPLAPSLRPTILDHTRKALGHIPPLSLCPASGERPQFLSKFVLQEVEKFVTDIALHEGDVIPEGLQMLLSFNLARGNVGGLLRTLKLLQENPDTVQPYSKLLNKMFQARDLCWEKSGHPLQMTLAGTDGGQTDAYNSSAENVLNQAWSSPPVQTSMYLSAEGHTKVNMIFKSSEYIQLTRLRIKVVSGMKGARRGLVFVYRDSKEFEMASQLERFQSYDNWGRVEYDFSVQVRSARKLGKPDNPVAYFTFEDDCDEIEVPVSWHPVGQYILVKFLEPRHESANKIGVIGVKFYGFIRKSVLVEEDENKVRHAPCVERSSTNLDIIKCVLEFLVDLSQDQASKRGISAGRPEYLELTDTPLDTIWELYNSFRERPGEKWQACSLLTLQLLYCLLPALSSLSGERKIAAEALFQHLCKVIDRQDKDKSPKLYKLCRQLIIDGAAVFFPDKDTRRKQLFSMMQNVESLSEAPSVMLVFQSLCQFFSSVDPSGLLDLPKTPSDVLTFHIDPVLEIMETMINVTFHEFCLMMVRGHSHEQVVHLLQLVSSLQTSLLAWAWSQMAPDEIDSSKASPSNMADIKAVCSQVTTQYSGFVADRATEACQLMQKKDVEKISELIGTAETSLLGTVVRQLVLTLTYLCDYCDSESRVELIKKFKPLSQELQKLAVTLPELFPNISSEHWDTVQTEDIVLRTWEVESSHSYENNQHFTQVFSCPGADKFMVDFDTRCETERRYDYLVFTDAKGLQMRFDQKVGTPKWPRQINFSGPHLHFLFHSDSSNTEWGYKFKVTARGSPDIPLSWPFDLQLSLTKMLGRMCGCTLNSHPFSDKDPLVNAEESAEQDVLRSELWTTLFRGGYMVGKIQRSLSGKFVTEDAGGHVLEFLWKLVNKEENLPKKFIDKCKESCKCLQVGGDAVESAVVAVFAALVWHTQQLREDLNKYVKADGEAVISDGIIQAYASAETLRTQLIALRQRAVTVNEKKNEDADDPGTLCRDKALFLLKFAGLTKVQLKNELRSKVTKQWKKLSNRKSEKMLKGLDGSDKYPSFRLVLEFVQDPAWTTDRVNHILHERSQHAKAVSDIYLFVAEFIMMHQCTEAGHPFQIPVVLFLQEILSYQDGFTKHYADSLDGCGLQQEARVRQAYYLLVRRLTEPFHRMHRHDLNKKIAPAYEYVQACLLHLLDIEWQPYDLLFVTEVKLPALFLSVAKETVKMRDCTLSQEEDEKDIRCYEQCMSWFEECESGFDRWYSGNKMDHGSREDRKAVQMFVARFCDMLDVEVSCDGCSVTLPGRRYRCLQCVDMDLCATCYAGGVKPEGDHSDDHDMVHLVYKCNKCQAFIVGTRIHCNECDDFDLCLGCHTKGKFPAEHLSSHDITKFPMIKLRPSQDSDSLIQAYIHQHVWLLFTVLALSTGDIIHTDSPSSMVDSDYVKLAANLQQECIDIVTHCLQQVPDDAEDSTKEVLQGGLLCLETRQEQAFAIHSQERIMGLLGAMIPQDHKILSTGVTYNFTTDQFIHLLFKIAKGESGHEVNTRHLAMGLLGPLLTKCPPKVADESVKSTQGAITKLDNYIEGQRTIEYLFSFGADCLEKCGLEWACSVARILQNLYSSSDWRSVIHHHLTTCVQSLTALLDLPSIFALFVMAGFPEVLTIGTLVQYNHMDMEKKKGVVLKHYPDKYQTLIIDIKTRKRHTVQDKFVECLSLVADTWDTDHVNLFISTIQNFDSSIRKEEEVFLETVWVLSLCLKVLNNNVKSMENCMVQNLFEPRFIQCLVYLASKGTEFSQQWLRKDLEVLSLMLYTNEGVGASHKRTKALSYPEQLAAALEKRTKSKRSSGDQDFLNESDKDNMSYLSSSSSSTSYNSGADSSDDDETEKTNIDDTFPDLDQRTKVMFETLHSDLKVPYSVLRAIFDMHDKNPDDVVKAIVENLENSPMTAKEDIERLSQKWESIAHTKSSEVTQMASVTDKVIDTGIHYHPVMTHTHRSIEKATEESGETQKLIRTPDNDLEDDINKQQRTKSAELLKQELEKQGRAGATDYLYKVNMAMSVLYARQVLISLLAQWPDSGHVISAELLGCKDVQQIPCVLDLLNKNESRDCFQQVVEKVIRNCETDSLVPIASTAGQFMEEVTLSSITHESEHNCRHIPEVKKSIQLPGASYLQVTFDKRCAVADTDDTLVFSSSPNMDANKHEFTGPWGTGSTNIRIPGDTLHYTFKTTKDVLVRLPMWGYKFTVAAGTRDSFETGYAILNKVLSTNLALALPLSDLWQILVYVATKQTGSQRLKAIQLLLKIVSTQHRTASSSKLTLDLSLLKPLWQLYNHMTKQEVDSNIVLSPVVRALTELFLQVESLAMEWDMVTEYLLSIQDIDEIRKVIRQGIMNVAAVSYMIGYKNSAVELVTMMKKKKTTSSTTVASFGAAATNTSTVNKTKGDKNQDVDL